MRKPSDTLYDLLNRLRARPNCVRRLVGSNAPLCAVLGEIAALREAAAVPYLIPLAFDASPDVALAASNAIHQLVPAVGNDDLVCLDEQIRNWSFWPGTGRWSQMDPRDVAGAATTGEGNASILGIIACHRNGRVRQEAVRLLGLAAERKAIPFLLLRVNDWVPSVRQAALDILQKWLAEGPFDAFLPHLYLVFRLMDCGRGDGASMVDAVVQRLVKPECEPVLLDLLGRGDRKVARRLFTIVLARKEPMPRIVLAGLESGDVIIRIRAAQAIPATFTHQQFVTVLERLRADGFAAVRNAALLMSLSHCPESAIEVLEEALLDRSPSVRGQAVFQLKKMGYSEVASHYREAIRGGKYVAVAILGLGETGNKSDVPVIRPYLGSQAASNRKAAVAALARLAGDECVDDFLGCLRDNSPKVVRTATRWLGHRTQLLNLDEIASLCFGDDLVHIKLAALAILHEYDTWEGLPHLIRAAASDDENVSLQSQRYIVSVAETVFAVFGLHKQDASLSSGHGLVNPNEENKDASKERGCVGVRVGQSVAA